MFCNFLSKFLLGEWVSHGKRKKSIIPQQILKKQFWRLTLSHVFSYSNLRFLYCLVLAALLKLSMSKWRQMLFSPLFTQSTWRLPFIVSSPWPSSLSYLSDTLTITPRISFSRTLWPKNVLIISWKLLMISRKTSFISSQRQTLLVETITYMLLENIRRVWGSQLRGDVGKTLLMSAIWSIITMNTSSFVRISITNILKEAHS